MSSERPWKIPQPLAIGVICILLGGAISFNAWAVSSISERPTKLDTKKMIDELSPYIKDRNMILAVLETIKDDIEELKSMVRNK